MIRTVAKQAALGARRAASDLLALDILGILRKQDEDDVLEREQLERRFRELAVALGLVFRREESRALERIANVLDVDWPSLSPEARARVLRQAADVLRGVPSTLRGRTLDRVQAAAVRMERRARAAARRQFNLKVPNRPPDDRIRAATAQSRLTPDFIEAEFDRRAERFEEVALLAILAGLQANESAQQIAARLAQTTEGFVRRPSYLTGVAASVLTRARTDALLGAFAEVGIDTYEIVAVLDGATCVKCRFMHGKQFSVQSGVDILGAVGKARTTDAIAKVNPFLRQGRNPSGHQIIYLPGPAGRREIVAFIAENAEGTANERGRFRAEWDSDRLTKAGIGPPPYHPICRCRIKPVRS